MIGTQQCRSIEQPGHRSKVGFAWAAIAFICLATNCVGEDQPGAAYAQVVEEYAKLDAEIQVLRSELAALKKIDGPSGSVILEGFESKEPVLQGLHTKLVELLDANFAGVPLSLVEVESGSVSVIEGLKRDLTAARTHLMADRRRLVEVGAEGRFLGQLASLINVNNRWMWLGGVIAFGTLLGLILHDRRHAVRRLLWVRRARAISQIAFGLAVFAIPLLPTIITFMLGDQNYDKLLAVTSQQSASVLGEDPSDQLNEIRSEISKLTMTRKQLAEEKSELFDKRQKRLAAVYAKSRLPEDWKLFRDRISNSHTGLLVTKSLATALGEDVKRLNTLKSKLSENEKKIKSNSQKKGLIGAAVGGTLLSLVLAGGYVFQKGVNARRKRISTTCPRCLSINTLEVEHAAEGTPAELRSSLSQLHCTNVFDEFTNDICNFTFPSQYRDRVKISFPTLGVASSGKTFWLAMVYQQLNLGRAPDGVHFERIQSSGSTVFDRHVADILQARIATGATRIELPEPLIFGFRDRDPYSFGGTDILVNMFDFAGTITVSRDLRNSIRIRQLNSEGYLFFLDPTKESDTQIEALLKFREEVKLVKGIGAGQQLDTPVALCLSKLDMAVYQHYALGGDVMSSFFDDLNRVDSQTQPMSLTRMKMRSELVGQLRDTIWQNWEIEKQIQGLFGDRFLFFPMTPVGLPPQGVTDEESINDLTQRTIEPYGILEPLLWLLHMNGYPVLKA